MNNVSITATRNFALIGHAGDGKTSLGEALLHTANATATLGRVDDGSSCLNHLPEERNGHTASVAAHVFGFDWSDHHLTLVDTPGDSNFAGAGLVALQALDGAILVVSAVDGVKAGSDKMLRIAEAAEMPALAFINGLDRERADFDAALASMADLPLTAVAVAFPVHVGNELSGIVDLSTMQFLGSDGSEGPIPDSHAEEAAKRRLELVESLAETDDTLLEKYLEDGELGDEAVRAGLVTAVRSRQLLPVFCGVATSEVGAKALLRGITEWLPSPEDRGAWKASPLTEGGSDTALPQADAPFSALVFKTIIDRYAGTLSILRVVSGTLRSEASILDATRGSKTRVGKLLLMQGEKHVDAASAGPGDVVAVTKLKDVHTGDVLTDEKNGLRLQEPEMPHGVISYAIEADANSDEDKVFASLARLVEEDPSLHLGREASTGEFLLMGMGELHIRTTVAKLKRVFEVSVNLKTPKVPYRETITRSVKHVEGKLKKQSGGKGMFGVCYLDLAPLPRGEGIQFEDAIVGGAIPRGLIPAVERGVLESCDRGPLAGFPVVDVKVRCVDGKHHPVDSNEMAFRLAGSFGFKSGIEKARPTILEPIMNAEVCTPESHVGDIMGDISSRRGRVQTTEARGAATVIKASVPMSEMLEYASSLTSMTGGTGTFTMEFSHYDEVPAHQREKLIEAAKAAAAETTH